MVSLCTILAILYFGGVLAVTLPYWYERGNSPSDDIPSAPYGCKAVIKLWIEASWSAFLLVIAFPLDLIARRLQKGNAAGEDENLPPVLLVHGLYHNPTGWMYMRRHLLKAGFRKIHTVSYSSWNTDLAAVTAALESAVKNLENLHAGEKPLLVGHSLGGLIIRNWLADGANQKRVTGAVTLGAPMRGSKMAAIAFGQLGKSLSPANPFFETLARTESPATVSCVALVSEADTMVLPQQNLVPVTRGWTMRLAPYSSHAGIMVKGAVSRMVAWELHRMVRDVRKNAAPVTPVPPVTEPGEPGKPAAPATAKAAPKPAAKAAAPKAKVEPAVKKAAASPKSSSASGSKPAAKPAAKPGNATKSAAKPKPAKKATGTGGGAKKTKKS